MPPLEVCDLRQWAVLWRFVKQDREGRPIVAEPVELKVRWLLNDAQVVDAFGNTVASSGTVIAAVELVPMSLMWLGRLRDLPTPPTEIHQVIVDNTTPDIKGRNTRYDFKLMKYSQKFAVDVAS